MNPALVFAVLLVSGHLVGEFLVQTRAVAEGKRRFGALLVHGVGLYASHWVLLYPFWTQRLVLGLVVLVAIHLLIDFVRAFRPRTLAYFGIDQLLHLVTLRVFWSWYAPDGAPALREGLAYGDLTTFTTIALLAGALGLNLRGGDMIVRLLLARFSDLKERLDIATFQSIFIMLGTIVFAVIGIVLQQWGWMIAAGFISFCFKKYIAKLCRKL